MNKPAAAALAAILALSPAMALTAHADDDNLSDARMSRIDAKVAQRGVSITRQQAMDIARGQGMARFEEIDLDDDDEWEIEGWTSDGREMEIDISARDGRIKDLEYDD